MAKILNASRPAKPERQLCCWPHCYAYLEDLAMPLCPKHIDEVCRHVGIVQHADIEHAFATEAARRFKRREDAGRIYFIRFGNRIKIGFSVDPCTRLTAIPHDEVLAVIPGTLADERALHRRFAHLREALPTTSKSGEGPREWFRIAPDLVAYIAQAKQQAA